MKKIVLSTILVSLIFCAAAQVTLDHKYDYSTSVVQLENGEYKYYLMDVPNERCVIYNADHSQYKIINCSVPNNWYLADVKLISEKLFDNDSGIELLYSYYKYIPTSDSYYYDYNTRIIDEDGQEIRLIEGGRYNFVRQTGDDKYQLFSYCFDYSVFPEKVWTNIYNLPGESVPNSLVGEKSADILLNAFPNPASQTVKVAYSLPNNVTEGKLFLFDNSGRPINQFVIDNHTNHLALDVTNMSNGVYHYFIEYAGTKSASRKLVVNNF